jgi:hypothetical protein
MADSTSISYSCNPLNEILANTGLDAEVGGTVIEYAPVDNTDVTYKGTLGWRPYGISETAVRLVPSIENYLVKSGMVSKTNDSLETGRAVEIPVTLMYPTWYTKMVANGSATATITEPDTPITTTIDETPTAATNFTVVVASVTGLVVGQEIGIVTGSSTYGTQEEFSVIQSIDAGTKTLTLVKPIFQLPADGAAVRVISEKKLSSIACDDVLAKQIRIVKFDRSAGNIRIDHIKRCKLKGIGGVDDGDGKVAAKYSFTLEVIANYNPTTSKFSFYDTHYIN